MDTLMSPLPMPKTTGLTGIGYEGNDSTEVIARLKNAGVDIVVDVRLTPISRKKGLSKTALKAGLAAAGIDYRHYRELGNPKDNRPGFAAGGKAHAQAVKNYRAILDTPQAREALTEIHALANDNLVALLCFEANQQVCHRNVILQALAPTPGSQP